MKAQVRTTSRGVMRVLIRTLAILIFTSASTAAFAASTSLVDAARRGDADAVRTLLSSKSVDVNAPGAGGSTALEWAVQRDDAKMVDALIRAGANVRAANAFGVQPVAIAAEKGNADVLRLLLSAGADPNAGLSAGETALMTAARTGTVAPIQLLLEHGAKVDTRDARGQTALMWAAARNNADAIHVLVKAGADIGVRTNNPPRGRAAETTIFNSPAPTGFTAFLFAVRAGGLAATRALLDAGADVNDKLSDGESALVVATANAHWELASSLLDRGADPNLAGAGWNALHQTVHSRRPNLGYTPGPVATGTLDSVEVLKKLIARGVNVNARM